LSALGTEGSQKHNIFTKLAFLKNFQGFCNGTKDMILVSLEQIYNYIHSCNIVIDWFALIQLVA